MPGELVPREHRFQNIEHCVMHFFLELLVAGQLIKCALLRNVVYQLLKCHGTRLAMHLFLYTQELLFD